jgi:GTPase SAR1 family protein
MFLLLGSVMKMYYRDANAAILVYDVKNTKSLHELSYWIEELNN